MQILNPIKMLEFLKDKIYVGFFWKSSLTTISCLYVYEALYQNGEIHGPWVNGSGSRVWPI